MATFVRVNTTVGQVSQLIVILVTLSDHGKNFDYMSNVGTDCNKSSYQIGL